MSDSVIDYAAIRARLNKATPGPWAGFEDEASGERYLGLFYDGGNVQPITQFTGDQEDAEFMAHSRTDLEQLLDRVEELERFAAQVKYVADDLGRLGERSDDLVHIHARNLAANTYNTLMSGYGNYVGDPLAAVPVAGEDN